MGEGRSLEPLLEILLRAERELLDHLASCGSVGDDPCRRCGLPTASIVLSHCGGLCSSCCGQPYASEERAQERAAALRDLFAATPLIRQMVTELAAFRAASEVERIGGRRG